MKYFTFKKAMFLAGAAALSAALTLGVHVVMGAATPEDDPPGTTIAPTFTGLTVDGDADVTGTLNVDLLEPFDDTFIQIDPDLEVLDDVWIGGTVTVGDAADSNVTISPGRIQMEEGGAGGSVGFFAGEGEFTFEDKIHVLNNIVADSYLESNGANITGPLNVGTDFNNQMVDVKGSLTVSDTLTTQNLTLNNDLTVNGVTRPEGGIQATDGRVEIDDSLQIDGMTTINSTLEVYNTLPNANIIQGGLEVLGNLIAFNDLTVNGTSWINGGIQATDGKVELDSNTEINGDLTASDGTIEIGSNVAMSPQTLTCGNINGSTITGTSLNGNYVNAVYDVVASRDLVALADVEVANRVVHDGDSNTYIDFQPDEIRFMAGNLQMMSLDESTQDIITIGDSSSIDANLSGSLFVDNSLNRVGINTTNPTTTFSVVGSILASDNILATDRIGIADSTPSYPLDVNGNMRTTGNHYIGTGILHDGDTNTNLTLNSDRFLFTAGGVQMLDLYQDTNRILLGSSGQLVGINDTTPSYNLDVNGSLRTTGNLRIDGNFYHYGKLGDLDVYSASGATAANSIASVNCPTSTHTLTGCSCRTTNANANIYNCYPSESSQTCNASAFVSSGTTRVYVYAMCLDGI